MFSLSRAVGALVSVAGLVSLGACGAEDSESPAAPDDTGALASSSGGGGTPSGDDAGPAPNDDAGEIPALDDPATRQAEPGFIAEIVSFEPGACAGFGQSVMPGVLFGAPRGAGQLSGSTDVVSLGTGGVLVVRLDPPPVDGAGVDFLVAENVFFANGGPQRPFQELAEVSVSSDGVDWYTYLCDPETEQTELCAGQRPVYTSPRNDIDPTDVERAGGDGFDLADTGVERAVFVRLRDVGALACEEGLVTNGFDLDAITVVNPSPAP